MPAAQPSDFCGVWRVDSDASDSIDPMLKAMGVGWKIRKIVMMLKVLQHIEVHEENFVVHNISKNGEDSTTHMINAGEKLIRTKRGDEVMDTCTFDPAQDFPLRIVAVLPHGKGVTEDLRRMNPDGSGFVQLLTYKYPAHMDKPDILMKRVFVQADDDPLLEQLEAVKAKHAPSVIVNTTEDPETSSQSSTSGAAAREPAGTPAPSSSQAKPDEGAGTSARPPQSPRPRQANRDLEASIGPIAAGPAAGAVSSLLGKIQGAGDADAVQSTELWVTVFLAVGLLTTLYFAAAPGRGPGVAGAPALSPLHAALPLLVYVLARILATTKAGRDLALYDARARWGGVVLGVSACTLVYHQIGSHDAVGLERRLLRFAAIATALVAFVVARIHAGLPAATEGAAASQDVLQALGGEQLALGLALGGTCGALVCGWVLGEAHPLTVACAGVAALGAFASWYATAVGYDRQKIPAGDGKGVSGPGRRKVRDKEGQTLKVAVVGSRVVDDMYAQYRVRVEHEGLAWFVWRRFSQFDTLRHELRRMFGHGVLPQLPNKTWFSSLDEDFLQTRIQELDEFLQALMDESLRKQVFKVAETRKFLGVGQGRGKPPEELAAAESQVSGVPKATPQEMREIFEILKKADKEFEKAISVGEGDGWTYLKNYNGVQCYLKSERDLTHTKGVGTIHAPPLVAAAYMSDPDRRSEYDDLYKRSTALREIDIAEVRKAFAGAPIDICDVVHVEYKSPFPMAVSARDSALTTFRQIEKDGTVKVIMASIPDTYCPPSSKYIRAKVFAAGIKLEPHPTEPNACLMSNVQMIDPNGSIPGWIVKAVAPERAGMSSKVEACMRRLSAHPDPIPVPHAHAD